MIKTLADITIPKSSSIKLGDTFESGMYPVWGASGICGYLDDYQVDKDSIVIVKDGAGIGRVHYMKEYSSALGTMQIIIPKEEVKAKYLFYLMKYLDLGKSFSGATIPHIYYKNYSKTRINIHDLYEQEKIIELLDNIEKSIENKSIELLSLDELIKSRFMCQEVVVC